MGPNKTYVGIDFTKGGRMLRDGKVPALAFYVGAEGRTFVRHPVVVYLPEIELCCRVSSIRIVAVSGAK